MHARSTRVFLPALALILVSVPLAAAGESEEEEENDLREQLTEREDRNRVEHPWTTSLFGNPLTAQGEYEITLEGTDPVVPSHTSIGRDRLLLEQQLEGEVFYTFGEPLSFFAQASVHWDQDLRASTPDGADDWYVERGEMWIHAGDLFGSGVNLDIGRLQFEDDRRWWWDEELDAVRVEWEGGPADAFGAELAVASELGPNRSDLDRVEADQEDRLRVLGSLSWDIAPSHGVEIFALFESDQSGHARVGSTVRPSREDESDARLFWLGPRVLGAFTSESRWILGYWVDGGWVQGDERRIEHGDPDATGRLPIEDMTRHDVSGWAVDAGLLAIAAVPLEPRVSISYAIGSGDSGDGRHDHAYRQSDLQTNETGFGGVRRFPHYGRLLDPELSNLTVATAAAGISLFHSSSLTLVYHDYRLVRRADELRDSHIDAVFDGRHRDVGRAFDLELAIEEGDRFEVELSGSAFRAGAAFGARSGDWAFGGLAALRIAF